MTRPIAEHETRLDLLIRLRRCEQQLDNDPRYLEDLDLSIAQEEKALERKAR